MESKRTSTTEEVHVFSLDADGCVYNLNYIYAYMKAQNKDTENKEDNNLSISKNPELLNHIAERGKNNATLMVGSNRQTHVMDEYNGKESFFLVMAKIEEYLRKSEHCDISIDPYLIADSFSLPKEREGETFKGNKKTTSPTDESKFLILYAQMHHIAKKHKNKKIHFHFYDDRLDIINPLAQYFKDHRDLLPPNLTLSLYSYDGTKAPELRHTILGDATNIVDEDYGSSIKKLHNLQYRHYHGRSIFASVASLFSNGKTCINLVEDGNIAAITKDFKAYRTKQAAAKLAAAPTSASHKPMHKAAFP